MCVFQERKSQTDTELCLPQYHGKQTRSWPGSESDSASFILDKLMIAPHPIGQKESGSILLAAASISTIHVEGITIPFHNRALVGRQQGQNFPAAKPVRRCRSKQVAAL